MRNVLTVDLEEWFVVEILSGRFDRDAWRELPSRVEDNTYLLLELFERKRVFATFFSLGWVAERHPQLMKDIVSAGHEIGCHSYWHRRVDELTQEEFREDTQRAIDVIGDVCGVRPDGYRAPSWSINSSNTWALETLYDLGFKYDSSIFPVKHDFYGDTNAPRELVRLALGDDKSLLEFPASTVRLFGRNLPVAGGGYLRHSPYWYSAMMIRRLNRDSQPAMVYVHPWEFDLSHPEVDGIGMRDRFRQYSSIKSLQRKLERLIDEFDFIPIGAYIDHVSRRPIGFGRE
jgi:polysaccharide deacetylase family protein (PEP-CTERM system associated)